MRNLFITGHVFSQENCVPKNGKQDIKIKEILKVTRYSRVSGKVTLSPDSCWPCPERLDNSRSHYAKGLLVLCNLINYQNISVL